MYDPCSIVADTIAPKADRINKRAALPLVSFFCSTTRASVPALAMPTPHRDGAFFPALSSRQLAAQAHNLPYMMIRMAGHGERNHKSITDAIPSIHRNADNSLPSGKVKDSLDGGAPFATVR
jgi:hypothetical protein